MIPAKIIDISDKVKVMYLKSKYDSFHTIAEVENAWFNKILKWWCITAYDGEVDYAKELSLNQSCFIEPTTEGKCKIVKL
jgi:hypothetical protein